MNTSQRVAVTMLRTSNSGLGEVRRTQTIKTEEMRELARRKRAVATLFESDALDVFGYRFSEWSWPVFRHRPAPCPVKEARKNNPQLDLFA